MRWNTSKDYCRTDQSNLLDKKSQQDTRKTDTHHSTHMSIATTTLAPIDDTTKVDFEIPPDEVAYSSNLTYRV